MTENSKQTSVGKGTASVWAGEQSHAPFERSTQIPVVHSVSFGYDDIDTWQAVSLGQQEGHIYSRNTNPTVRAFEEKICTLEGAEAATSFSTGMAAISGTLFTFLRPSDRIVSIKDSYGGTNKLFTEFLPAFGIHVGLCDTTDFQQIEREIRLGCKLLYLETPTNPTVKIVDIERLAKVAHQVGALVVVDNTFATPINQNPIPLGADIVLHSATKFLGGHADALGGAACGNKALIQEIYHFREINGAALSPADAYNLLRGMKTLSLRVTRQNESALTIARWLQRHPAVDQVNYPGLESHPQYELARRQMKKGGTVVAFDIVGDKDACFRFLDALKLVDISNNLGDSKSLVTHPATTTHSRLKPEERAALGIGDGLVRLSAGLEAEADLLTDLSRALEAV